MLFVSSAFVPVDGMPKVVRLFVENQPMTPIIQAIRNLFNSHAAGNDLWISIGWMVLKIICILLTGVLIQ